MIIRDFLGDEDRAVAFMVFVASEKHLIGVFVFEVSHN